MNTFRVGDVIRKTRVELRITQEQLSDGICSVSSLSKIENNSQVPTKVNFDALMQRMGQSGEMYYAYVSERDFEIQELKHKINRKINIREFEKAAELLVELEKEVETKENLNIQFVLYIKGLLKKNLEEDLEGALKLLNQAIHITIPKFGKKELNNYLLTDIDIAIINNIAIVYHAMNDIDRSISFLYEIKDYLENSYIDRSSKAEYLPVILYNLSKWLGLEKRFEEAIEICDKGIDACIEYGAINCFAQQLYNKGCDLFELGRKEESVGYFKQAYYLFLAQKKNEFASELLANTKNKYQIELNL